MASTINASTSPAAIIQTADGTAILALQTGNTTAVTIDASQNVGIGSTPVNSRRLTLNTSAQTDLSIVAGSTNYAQLLFGYTGADNKGIISYYNNDNSMQFYTNASERMRINSASVGIGSTLTTSGLTVGYVGSNGWNINTISTTTAGVGAIVFTNPNGVVGSINTSGSTTGYATSSDYRLKENIVPMTDALNTVAKLKPVNYKWKVDGSDGQGFIAHELQEVVPEAVCGEKDAVETYTDEDGIEQTKIKPQGVDTSFLVATLTAAIQEQQALITSLTARITALEGA